MTHTNDVLGRFFEYRANDLQSQVNATRDVITHALTKGIEAETALADLLSALLPKRFDARKGFVIDSDGCQSNEMDLIVVDRDAVARLFDFRAFELVPIEAASACVEVKTTLDGTKLLETFARFQRVQEMRFREEQLLQTRSVSLVASTTTRPEMAVFSYEGTLSPQAIRNAYAQYPQLDHVKICVLNQGIVAHLDDSPQGPLGLGWLRPVEEPDTAAYSGRVLALFLYQFFLPSLFEQRKGSQFYRYYLQGQSDFEQLEP